MDPIYGKLATTAVEKAARNSEKEVSQPLNGGDSPFKQMLQGMDVGQDMANMLDIGQNTGLGSSKMEAMPADEIKLDPGELNVGLEEPKGAEKIV
ncbi:MAG: hypothetical protein HYT75_02065, partial [Deltaproteobacteria bacterium]|nr:hypothetical protein [Deltaproteobacteria bacterium]